MLPFFGSIFYTGVQGFEPQSTDPESVVLPIAPYPIDGQNSSITPIFVQIFLGTQTKGRKSISRAILLPMGSEFWSCLYYWIERDARPCGVGVERSSFPFPQRRGLAGTRAFVFWRVFLLCQMCQRAL